MPRLFTAIEIPAAVADALAAARGGIYGARWREPDDYHITLRFIGDVDGRMASEIADTLDTVRKSPVSIQFDGLNWFGGEKPRAIVARIKPTPGLIDLQAEHERRLRRLGLPPETRNFTPHVTLASLRSVSVLGRMRTRARSTPARGASTRRARSTFPFGVNGKASRGSRADGIM